MKEFPVRPVLRLDGEFRFTFDPDGRGLREEWFRRADLPAARVTVPAPWQAVLHSGEPVGWYWKRFSLPPTFRDRRTFLRFEAVDAVCHAWVNGKEAGTHAGGYSPFELDISDCVDPAGSNLLAVRVADLTSRTARHPEIPPGVLRGDQGHQREISGIWRPVCLEARHPVHLHDVALRTALDPASLTVRCHLVGSEARRAPVELVARVLGDEERVLAEETAGLPPDATDLGITLEPARDRVTAWSLSHPRLYQLEVEVRHGGETVDTVRTRFGFRTVDASSSGILLNGEPCYIRGILYPALYDHGLSVPHKAGALRAELTRFHAQGFNLVRSHAKPLLPTALDICDELGLLVWQETPVGAGTPWDALDETGKRGALAFREIEDLVRRDRHHPSLIIWGITSENQQSTTVHGDQWMHRTTDRIRELHPGSTVIENSDPFHFGAGTARSDILDFHLYRDAPGGGFASSRDSAASIPGISALNSEFGAWGFPAPSGLETDGEYSALFENLARRFDDLGLGDTFPSLEAFCLETQMQQFRSIKHQVEDFRLNGKVTGSILAAGHDCCGTCVGLLDAHRCPRSFLDRVPPLNAALLPIVEWPTRNYFAGREIELFAVVSNRSAEPVESLRIEYRAGRVEQVLARGTLSAGHVPPNGYGGSDGIVIALPGVDSITPFKLILTWKGLDGEEMEIDWPFWAYPLIRDLPSFPVSVNLNGSWPEVWNALPHLEASTVDLCDILLSTRWDQAVKTHLDGGGAAVIVCDRFEAGKVGVSEDMNKPFKTSFVRQNHPVFTEFPYCRSVDMRFQSLVPAALMTGVRRPIAGWFRRWEYLGAAMAEFRVGAGRLLVTTFRFDRLGEDPMADHLLHAMIQYAAGEDFHPTEPLFL